MSDYNTSQTAEKSGSRLERLLAKGEFVVTSELGPPKSADISVIEKKCGHLKGVVDAVNITDNQTAIVRVSSIATAAIALKHGLEPIIQMTCRDRNRIAIQSDILGAAVLGMKNILCITGDHQKFGNHPTSKNVFDIDSVQLIEIVRRMRDEGIFANGEEIRNAKKAPIMPPRFFIGAAANPFGDPFEFRVIRLAKKVAAGADFIQTQCIYNMKRFREYMKQTVDRGLHERCRILAGLTPLKSFGMARYMASSVAGLSVPDEILERMKGAADPTEEGLKLITEQIEEVRGIPGIAGIHIMAIEWEDHVGDIVRRANLYPRPEL